MVKSGRIYILGTGYPVIDVEDNVVFLLDRECNYNKWNKGRPQRMSLSVPSDTISGNVKFRLILEEVNG